MQGFFDFIYFSGFLNIFNPSNRGLFLSSKFRKTIRILLFSFVIGNYPHERIHSGVLGLIYLSKLMKRILYFMGTLLLISSCMSINKFSLFQTGGIQEIISNLIIDFSETTNTEKGKVYEFYMRNDSENISVFSVGDNPKIYMDTINYIGKKSRYFPTKYKEINDRLYIWNDSTVAISKDFIQKLNEYKVVDSTIYRIQKGELSIDEWPTITTKESKKSYIYFVCKKDISKYVKEYTNKIKSIEDYPIKGCDEN